MKARVITPTKEEEFCLVLDFKPDVYIVLKDPDGVNRFIDLTSTVVEITDNV